MQRYRQYGSSYSSSPSSVPVEEVHAEAEEEEEEEVYTEEEVYEEEAEPLIQEEMEPVVQETGGANEEEVPQTKGEVQPVVEETEGKTPPVESKNGKRTEKGGGGGGGGGGDAGGGPKYSMFTWFVVLALLGVWSSVAVVYFEIVDYDSVIARAKEFHMNFSEVLQGKLTAYDTDGDGDFDVEDAKVLLDEKKLKGPALRRDRLRKEDKKEAKKKGKSKEDKTLEATDQEIKLPEDDTAGETAARTNTTRDRPVRGVTLRSALKEELRTIHRKMEAKRIARIALAEIRAFLAEEEEEREAAWVLKVKTLEAGQEQLKKEKERMAKEEAEKERMEKEKAEKERMEKERMEKERIEKERMEKERIEKERIEKERMEKEKMEKERIEKERMEKERIEKERIEKERMEKEKMEKERIEKERMEKERIEKAEKVRIEKEKMEKEKVEKERMEKLARERAEKERQEMERLAKEKAAKEERERLERARAEKEKMERERRAREKAEKEQQEKERLERERAEKERIERERIAKERERIAREKAEKERLEKERIAKEKAEKERLERERIAKERERIAREKERQEKERLAKERAEKERLERERIAKERERLERERVAREKMERERAEKERLAKERAEKERLERERIAKERERIAREKERAEKERLEKERLAREKEKMERERIARERARVAQEKERQEKAAKEKAEQERLEKERAARQERERMAKERERMEQLRAEKERLERAKAAREKFERERAEKEKAAREKELMERQRLARDKALRDKMEAERQRTAVKVDVKQQEGLERKANASQPKAPAAEERRVSAVRREEKMADGGKKKWLKEPNAPHVSGSPEGKTETAEKLVKTTNQHTAEPQGAEPTEATPSETPAEETASVSESGPSPVHGDDEGSRFYDVESEIQAAVPLPALVEDDFVPDDPGDSEHPHEGRADGIDTTGVLLEEPPPEESEVESGQYLTSSKFTQEAEPAVEAENQPEPAAEPAPQSETESDPAADGATGKQAEEKPKETVSPPAKKKKPKLLNKFDKTIKAEIDAAEKLRKKGKLEEALRAFETLVQLHPQSPRARYGRAQTEDDMAEKMRSNDMLQRAINSYRDAAELPDVTPDLLRAALKRRAERQQFLGRMRGSLATLERLTQIFPEDIGLKNDLGVAHLLLGDNKGAKKVYEEVLAVAPSNGFAKVHYGFILKSENKIAESIPFLKEGLESGEPGTDDGRFYFHLGDALQRVGDNSAYHWYELGHQHGHFASVWQRSLYNVDGLKAQPWWTPKETGYTDLVKTLERNWKTIRDEALAVMDQSTRSFVPEDENLRERGEWGQYTLWQQGKKVGNSCQGVPKTCSLLERYSEATGCKRGQIKFSVMQPGTHVWPHTGPTNCRLRMHLGLVIPKQGCRIRCTDQTREWEEGKVLIFDDSFEHEVWQEADSYRLIFIVDVWHPELTAYQRQTLSPI